MDIKTDIRNLYGELKKIQQRLDQLEGKGSIPPLPQSLSNNEGESTEPHFELPQELKPKIQATNPTPIKEKKAIANDSSSTGFLMGAIGSICFILGAALLVRLAIESGWLTPVRQWSLVGLLGLSLCLISIFFKKRDTQYIGYLAAVGIIILYFTAYAGHLIFEIYGQYPSIGFVTATTCFALWLHSYFKNDFFALTAAAGTYLAPLLLGSFTQHFETISSYFLLWTFCFSLISFSMGSRVLNLLSAYMGIGIFALINLHQNQEEKLIAIIVIQALQFIFISSSVTYQSLKLKTALTSKETNQYFPVLLFFYGTEYFFLHKWSQNLAPWLSICFAIFLLVLSSLAKRKLSTTGELQSMRMAQSFSAVVFFHCVYLNLLPDYLTPYLVTLILLGFIYVHNKKESSAKNTAVTIVFGLIAVIEFSKICKSLFYLNSATALIPAATTVMAMYMTYAFVIKDFYKSESTLFLYVIHFLVVASLYQFTKEWGSLAVTISWGLYACLILSVSYKIRDWILNKSSVFVLLLAGLKALLYDAANAPTLVRVLCLLATGVLLYSAGYMFRRMGQMSSEKPIKS